MVWIIVIGVVVFLFYSFNKAQTKSFDNIANQGGMSEKYKVLLRELLEWHPNFSVLRYGSNFIVVGMRDSNSYFEVVVMDNFNLVDIKLDAMGTSGAKFSTRLTYNNNLDQILIFNQIKASLEVKADELAKTRGL